MSPALRPASGEGTPSNRRTGPLLFLMRLGHRDHAVEAEVELRRAGRGHGRAPTLVGVATIDPGAGQAELVRGRMVVEEALRGMQDVLLLEAEVILQTAQHVFEVARAGLVR